MSATAAASREVGPALMCAPRSVEVAITSQCNLRCRYCSHFDNAGVTYCDLPTGEWLRFLDELGRCAVMDVTIGGGEPLMRADLPQILDGVVRNRLRFTLLSNGALLDDDVAALLAATGRCDGVQVSVDGSRPQTHDAMRGTGSFEAALRALRALERHGVPATARVTVHRGNVHDLDAISRLLLDEVGLAGFSTNSAGYFGSCRRAAPDLILTVAERQRAMRTLLGLAERYEGRITAAAGPLAEAWAYAAMEGARTGGEPPFPGGGRLTGCSCVWSAIAVRSDGVYVPCSLLPAVELGRMNRDPLLDVWRHHPTLDAFRRRRELPLAGFAFCSRCDYVSYCTGNCPAAAVNLAGSLHHPSPDACLQRFLQAGGEVCR